MSINFSLESYRIGFRHLVKQCIPDSNNVTKGFVSRECPNVTAQTVSVSLPIQPAQRDPFHVNPKVCVVCDTDGVCYRCVVCDTDGVCSRCVVCDTDGVCYRCGIRSSFMEVVNLDSEVQTVLDCISSISDCSIYAQIVIDVFADPPQPGDPSYQLFIMAIRRRQADHALLIETILNSEVGIYCCPIQGGVFAYPRIHIPPKALEAAQVGLSHLTDVFYCTRLLEETGILVLAGSYLSQRPGTHYIRLTLLLETEMLRKILRTITQFHRRFTSAFS
uniref:alanine transaminase n=1 Tax=Callorhinchus milii TaxID=7868 RepID=A0A4W3GL60_CALMI